MPARFDEAVWLRGAYRFREAGREDWPGLARLHAASWRAAYKDILSDRYLSGPVETERQALWRDRLGSPPGPDLVIILAEEHHAACPSPVGFCCALAGHHPQRGSLIDNLHVRPGQSRKRLGRALLATVARQLEAGPHGRAPIHLTVFEENSPAIAAYERWGGVVAEAFENLEADGGRHRVRRYTWPSPARLIRCLEAAT